LAQPVAKLKEILVPLTGDPTDRDAVDLACRLAKATKAHVFAAYVIEVKRTLPLDADIPPEIDKGDLALRGAEELGGEYGLEIEAELLQAREPGPALVDEAIERGVDLIIVGLEYRTRFGDFDPGKIVSYLLRKAPCRVWVLRGPIPS
jgi:nucleotide-binding universal stress UspA family protein